MTRRQRAEALGSGLAGALAPRALLDLPVPIRDADQVHRTADEVLSRPEFRQAARPLLSRLWDWALARLGELLVALVGTSVGSIVGLLLFLLILAAVAALAVRFARGVTRDPEVAAAIPTAPRRGAQEWRAAAQAHERAGEWRQALRCRYRALVADLARRGLVEEVPGGTAGEYRGEVERNLPAAAEAFAGATELFERAWYGRTPMGAGELSHFRDLAGRVLDGIRA
jgi:pimeloyl-ACP methyl ester carboxylesterase